MLFATITASTSGKELAINMQSMTKEQERFSKSQAKAFERIEALEKKPADRLNTLITAFTTAIISAVVTYFFTVLV